MQFETNPDGSLKSFAVTDISAESTVRQSAVARRVSNVPERAADTVFESLFDGNLDGFTQRGGTATFELQDGELIGTSVLDAKSSFLCTTRDYDDFMLEYEFKADAPLNSGVQIRSHSRPDFKNGQVHGYQIEIDAGGKFWNAAIFEEATGRGWLDELDDNEPARPAFRPNEWNTVRVECRDDSIKTWLNGVPAADLTDEPARRV